MHLRCSDVSILFTDVKIEARDWIATLAPRLSELLMSSLGDLWIFLEKREKEEDIP